MVSRQSLDLPRWACYTNEIIGGLPHVGCGYTPEFGSRQASFGSPDALAVGCMEGSKNIEAYLGLHPAEPHISLVEYL